MSGYWDRNAGGVDDETEKLLQRIKDLEQYRVGAEARIAELEAELHHAKRIVDLARAWSDTLPGAATAYADLVAAEPLLEAIRGERKAKS